MQATFNINESICPPSLFLLGTEPLRAAFEFVGMKAMNRQALPKGDGHAVVIFPGLGTGHKAMAPLKELCEDLGYAAFDWGRGFNTGPEGDVDAWLDQLASDVQDMTRAHEGPITLMGWSLGGIYARELAKRLPQRVRQVITIGSPFAGTPDHTHARWMYQFLNGNKASFTPSLTKRLAAAPQVPTTSIFSRTDGIVPWQACIQEGGDRHCENIEVSGSHCGLGWNREVFRVVADRLCHRPAKLTEMNIAPMKLRGLAHA